jgi:hypothetical protein
MLKIYCDNCGADITDTPRAQPFELGRNKHHFCNRECRLEYDKKIDHFKSMSVKGKAGRIAFLATYNSERSLKREKDA